MDTPLRLPSLLLVDDDPLIRDSLRLVLSEAFDIHLAEDRPHAIRLLRDLDAPPQLALVDLGLPPMPHRPEEGFRLISELLAFSPGIKVITLSGQSEESNARHARALGAIDFIAKPCSPEKIKALLLDALHIQIGQPDPASGDDSLSGIIGQSVPIQAMREQIRLYASTPFPILIEGESGSGKELVAAALKQLSPDPEEPYVAFNCAAISPNLLESALFGHTKGAFTGALAAQPGFFEQAGNGTIFLDEIGELPLEFQSKLLRILENGEYQRVGETATRKSRARVIAATNRDLRQAVRTGLFRADLYHRLSVFTIHVPPLRELEEDRQLLLDHFRHFYAQQANRPPFQLDAQAQKIWKRYPFPGNTRELRNIAIRLATKHPGQIINAGQLEAELDLQQAGSNNITLSAHSDIRHTLEQGDFSLDNLLMEYTDRYIGVAMEMAQGNVSDAARLLGMARTTLYSRMGAIQKHKMQRMQ